MGVKVAVLLTSASNIEQRTSGQGGERNDYNQSPPLRRSTCAHAPPVYSDHGWEVIKVNCRVKPRLGSAGIGEGGN
jgi:hypothetical protein